MHERGVDLSGVWTVEGETFWARDSQRIRAVRRSRLFSVQFSVKIASGDSADVFLTLQRVEKWDGVYITNLAVEIAEW